MGCTPSKKELEKQTGERPGDEPLDQKNGRQKNGALKKNNEEIVRAKAPVTLTPNGDADGLRISTLDGLPSDIKFIDADEESLMRASVQDVTAAQAVAGNKQDSEENRQELEERIECLIETNTEATPSAGGVDPAAEGAKSEDRYYNNKAFEEPDIDPSNPDQQDAALKIQTQYRKHRATEEVQTLREEQAAVKIQAGIRGYQDRQKVKAMKEDSEKSEAAEETTEAAPEDDIDLNDPEVQQAATKIQAGFRGHQARKEVQEMKGSQEELAGESQPAAEEAKPEPAAEVKPEEPAAAEAKTEEPAAVEEAKPKEAAPAAEPAAEAAEPEPAAAEVQESAVVEEESAEVETEVVAESKEEEEEEEAATVEEEKEEVQQVEEPEKEQQEEAQVSEQPEAETKVEEPEAKTDDAEVKDEEAEPQVDEPKVEEEAKTEVGESEPKAEEEAEAKVEEEAKTEVEAEPKAEESEPKAEESEPKAEESTEVPQTTTEEEQTDEVKIDEDAADDIDLDDPEVAAAAAKIQAGFRGMLARNEVKGMKEAAAEPEASAEEPKAEDAEAKVDIDLNDPEVQAAAVKIQASVKGYLTRKEMNKEKGEEVDQTQE